MIPEYYYNINLFYVHFTRSRKYFPQNCFLNLPNKPKLSNVKYLNTKAEKQLNKIEIKTFSANVFSI